MRQGKICEQGGGGKRNNSSVGGIANHHRHKKGLRDPHSVRGLKSLRDAYSVRGSKGVRDPHSMMGLKSLRDPHSVRGSDVMCTESTNPCAVDCFTSWPDAKFCSIHKLSLTTSHEFANWCLEQSQPKATCLFRHSPRQTVFREDKDLLFVTQQINLASHQLCSRRQFVSIGEV